MKIDEGAGATSGTGPSSLGLKQGDKSLHINGLKNALQEIILIAGR